MRLYEWEAKRILQEQGIAVPAAERVCTPDDAAASAARLGGRVVVKAQVPFGRRMKAGGVQFAEDAEAARGMAAGMLGRELGGFCVKEVLVEVEAPAGEEIFLAITYDTIQRAPVLIASRHGGIEVEGRAADAQTVRRAIDMTWPLANFVARDLAIALGLAGPDLVALTSLVERLYDLFYRYDAVVAEINPLRHVKSGVFLALDAHVELDDDALYRHADLGPRWGIQPRRSQARAATAFEEAAERIDAQDHRGVAGHVVDFPGDLGLLIGGGGASLAAFDAILSAGGQPANYCEIGGNPSVRKIRDLTKLILTKPGVRRLAVIMNVVNNTRVDLVARGVIKGVLELGRDPSETITVFRIPGAWEDEGTKILRHYGVACLDRSVSLDEAARRAVQGSR